MVKLRSIKKVSKGHVKQLREDFRSWLIEVGGKSQNPRMIKWAKELDDNAIEFCLHLGFSEKAFIQSISDIVEKDFLIVKKEFHNLG